MLSKNKAKEMKRRASQRRATHMARRVALTLRAERRMAGAAKAEIGKTEVRSKGHVKPTVKKASQEKITPDMPGYCTWRRTDTLSGGSASAVQTSRGAPHYLSWSC
jgi:hypothetical protein